jgi:MinD-like ATPase involved in chromosome partitioning or flagellar assembly/tetratricopeptide (TPR) repeat protein
MNDMGSRGRTRVVGLVAAGGGTGRTGAVTNLAWILASADNRVLVVDWGTEGPSVHDYLRPFLVSAPSPADSVDDGVSALVPTSLELREYAVPAGRHRVHVLAAAEGTSGTAPTDQQAVKWNQWLRDTEYDYVLIDGPTDVTEEGLSRVAQMCDVVLLFFLPRRTAIEQASTIARGLSEASATSPSIVPVASQFDDKNPARAERSRDAIRAAFADLRSSAVPVHDTVELPYHPYDEYDEALAVLIDEPRGHGTPLAAYERLAAAVTDGRVSALSPAPTATRDRYRLGLPAPQAVRQMAITYAVADRPWADWVRQRLERAGMTVFLVRPERDLPADARVSSLVVVAPARRDPGEHARIQEIVERLGGAAELDVVHVVVPDREDTGPAPADAPAHSAPAEGGSDDWIVVGNRHEVDVGVQLLARFGLFDLPGGQSKLAIRFPGDIESPILDNLPPRREDFVGRRRELERLRDGLTTPGQARRWVCVGPAGAGKSELVREYAHRFGFQYDLIWWIAAHDTVAVRAGLLRLADAKSTMATGDGIRTVLDALSSGRWYERSLLIYDNADDLDHLLELGLLPAGRGVDVLVTTRNRPRGWDVVDVGSLSRQECASLLRAHVPELEPADAAGLGDAIRHQALATRLAAGWLADAVALRRGEGADSRSAATLASTELVDRFSRAAEDEVLPAAIELLRSAMSSTVYGRLALYVADLCAHLSPDGASLRLLRSDAFLRTVAEKAGPEAERLLLDAAEFDQILWTGAAYGLYDVVWGQAAALLNRPAMQSALRQRPDAGRAREMTLAALAAYAPNEAMPWTAGKKAKYDELQRHIFASEALSSTDPAVRRWLVNHLTFLFLTGEGTTWRYSRDVASEVVERWRSTVGDEDELVLRMRGQLANFHRAMGEFDRAQEIDAEVLGRQRRVLGNRHLQTLISARARAADLRSLGRYAEAYAEDHEAHNGFRSILGDDHPNTRMASHNLAISAYLVGDAATALRLQREHHARQARLLGRQYVDTWKSAASIGVYLRELGRLDEAEDTLTEAQYHVSRAHTDDVRHPDVLWIDWQLAVVRRRRGNHLRAKESNTRTVKIYRDRLGKDNPNTLGCQLSLAADHHASGDDATAVSLARECLAAYEHMAANHPTTAVCRMNQALYLRSNDQVTEALAAGRDAMERLTDRLGPTHPWTLTATANHAVTLAVSGNLAAARELAAENDDLCGDLLGADLLGTDHPCRVVSAHNLAWLRAGTDSGWHEMEIDVLPT